MTPHLKANHLTKLWLSKHNISLSQSFNKNKNQKQMLVSLPLRGVMLRPADADNGQ